VRSSLTLVVTERWNTNFLLCWYIYFSVFKNRKKAVGAIKVTFLE
jgi:hypothetical protein